MPSCPVPSAMIRLVLPFCACARRTGHGQRQPVPCTPTYPHARAPPKSPRAVSTTPLPSPTRQPPCSRVYKHVRAVCIYTKDRQKDQGNGHEEERERRKQIDRHTVTQGTHRDRESQSARKSPKPHTQHNQHTKNVSLEKCVCACASL